MARSAPNILICGSPGTGKSTLADEAATLTQLKHLDISKIAAEKELFDGFDEERGCGILDDDKILDEIEEDMEKGGNIVDYHGCEFFPERWFDVVLVLRTDNTKLFDRLIARGYPESKVRENVQCEIFGVLLEEARSSYPTEIVHELKSDSIEDMESNVDRISEWVKNFATKS